MPVVVEQSRVIAAPVEKVFTAALDIPLPTLLPRRSGPFPPIKTVRGQTNWAQAGDSRTILPAGGGSMLETLTGVDVPVSFGYAVTEITGPMAFLVDHIDGLWTFRAEGAGTTATWQWTLHPKSVLTAPIVAVLGRLWHGYARQALHSLSAFIVR